MDGMSIGDPRQETDCDDDVTWRRWATSRDLFKAWSPPPASPWSGYAKPTLFAAVDDFLHGLNPRPYRTTSMLASGTPDGTDWQTTAPDWARTEPIPPPTPGGMAQSGSAPTFLAASGRPTMTPKVPDGYDPHGHPAFPRLGRSAIVIDLPGPQSVAVAAQLAHRAGLQPTVLFNNWPHSRGIVAMGDVLGALLYFSPWAEEAPARDDPAAPPAFVLDRDRLGHHRPHPDDFDNRYYHPDADLPSANTLVKAGLERVLYLHPAPTAPSAQPNGTESWIPADRAAIPPGSDARFEAFLHELGPPRETPEPVPDPLGPPEMDDLNPILVAWSKRLPVATVAVDTSNLQWAPIQPYSPRPRPTPFNTSKDPSFAGFRRSAAGGFGALVPVPGQGGIGGVGG